MIGLDPEIAVHKLNISKDVKPVKQDHWHTKLEIMEKIEKECKSFEMFNLLERNNTLTG